MPYAAAYLRRSYATEGRPGDASEDTQLEAVRRLCGSDVTIYKDWGISGRKNNRPEYQRLRSDIMAGKVVSVCAYSLSRLGRSTRELIDFAALCKDHSVTLRTATDAIDTTSASGRMFFGIMASVAEFEADVTAERMAGARMARRAKAESAGALLPGDKLPSSIALYGFRHETDADGVIRRQPDDKHPIQPIIDAYREAGSLTRAVKELNRIGIPSPKAARTGKPALWGSSTLARVLRAHDATLLPERGATGRQRPEGQPALFRRLLVCHCGGLMTPNVARGQYRCSRADDKLGVANHGPAYVSEAALKAALWSEVARQYQAGPKPIVRERDERAIADLHARRERVAAAMLDGLIDASRAKAETEAIDSRLEKLERQVGALTGFANDTPLDLNGDPAEQNALLRRLWLRVRLDGDMQPHVEWIIDPDIARAQEEEAEAAYYAPGPNGEPSQHDREVDQMMTEKYARRTSTRTTG